MGVTAPAPSTTTFAVDEHLDLVDDLARLALAAGAPREAVGAAVESLYASAEALVAAGARDEPAVAAPPPRPVEATGRYEAQVVGLRRTVCAVVPPGAVVAVVSRGDDALLELPERRGVHLPCQSDGSWTGFHPRHGADAFDALQRAQALGATHLAVPAPSLWWLAFYVELRRWLQERAALVHAGEDGLVYALPSPGIARTPPGVARRAEVERLRRLLATVLPRTAHVAVASAGDDDWLGVSPTVADHFPATPYGAYAGEPATAAEALAQLHRARRAGVEYLVVPAAAGLTERVLDEFRAELRRTFPVVVERSAVGVVFALTRRLPPTPTPTPPNPTPPTPTGR